jgi:hypothetical protein
MDLPSEPRLRWLLTAAARLHEGGAEPVSGLVLPTPASFPDPFDRSRRSVERLLWRVLKHAGLSDLEVGLDVVDPESAVAGGCSSGGCATVPVAKIERVARAGDGWRVRVVPQEVGNPTVLTTVFARAAARIFLGEAELVRAVEGPIEAAVDVAAVLLGFGVLLCNGSYIYAKGCGGVSVASATALPVEEIAVLLAMACKLFDHKARELDPTPRAHFAEAKVWADSNASVLELVRTDPRAVEAGSYSLAEPRRWLSRLVGLGRARGPSAPTEKELQRLERELAPRQVDDDAAARRAQLRALVDEALDEG